MSLHLSGSIKLLVNRTITEAIVFGQTKILGKTKNVNWRKFVKLRDDNDLSIVSYTVPLTDPEIDFYH